MAYCAYLRKSRKDLEIEAYTPGETLARHEQILTETAKRMDITIEKIYREVVSGETIASRPQMQLLLQDINNGMWEGVLVVEVERLARGDTQDQGIIAKALKYSSTKVITPTKTYDPENEFDEEYLEFGLFMSRREYKTITRRMQMGRLLSAKQGKYVGNKPPFGYERIKIKNDKGFTLQIIPEEAEIVRLIFNNFVGNNTEPKGNALIANILNNGGYKPRFSDVWTVETISGILKNPAYIGKIRWGARKEIKKIIDGKVIKSRPRNDENAELFDGLHDSIIDETIWQQAQLRRTVTKANSARYDRPLQNSFAGLIKCGCCGRTMTRKDCKGKIMMICTQKTCSNIGSFYDLVEQSVLTVLQSWVNDYNRNSKSQKLLNDLKANITQLTNELNKMQNDKLLLESQLTKLYNLLEQDVYSIDLFKQRQGALNLQIEQLDNSICTKSDELAAFVLKQHKISTFIPRVIHTLDIYKQLPDATQKNNVLKNVIDRIIYTKSLSGTSCPQNVDKFDIVVYPKI
ncbi:MAG: recombinase family protein [Oscillospiraceae bacterium]